MMKNQHIKNIEIIDYRCFDNFKAEGFKRVNLITGDNNIGKTSFLEACFLKSEFITCFVEMHGDLIKDDNRVEDGYLGTKLFFDFYIKRLILIEQNRDKTNFLLDWLLEEFNFSNTNLFNINLDFNEYEINTGLEETSYYHVYDFRSLVLKKDKKICFCYYHESSEEYMGRVERMTPPYEDAFIEAESIISFRNSNAYHNIYKKNHPPKLDIYNFVTPNINNNLVGLIDNLKLENKLDEVNGYLFDVFDVQQIDIIKNKVMLKKDNRFQNISAFGDGLQHFINIIVTLLSHKNSVIYIDEIENGIHFTNFDKLWEIILTISKKQNIQVFATTHSKDCIESYSKILNKLNDNDISLINLSQNLNNETVAMILDKEMLDNELKQNHEVRSW